MPRTGPIHLLDSSINTFLFPLTLETVGMSNTSILAQGIWANTSIYPGTTAKSSLGGYKLCLLLLLAGTTMSLTSFILFCL